MALKSFGALDLASPECARSWMLAFGALARAKGWKDTNVIEGTDDVPATAAVTALRITFWHLVA